MPNIEFLISDSQLAFLNQQNETALELANQAIALDVKNSDAYKCAANAQMSLERYDDAIKNYRLALKYDPANGNRYFDLGFALATNEKLADALKYLAKADELGCTPENLIQLYNLLGIICFDIGRYEDSLVNLEKAEQLAGVNVEILQRKAIIHGIRNEIRKGLEVTNQIKLVAPSEYLGYQLAFKLLIQAKRLETAAVELKKAARFAAPTMELYFDKMTLELELYKQDKNQAHLYKALEIITQSLENVKPDLGSVVESYINAAELHLQLENAEKTIECLNAAQSPVDAYNNGFQIMDEPIEIPPVLDEYDVEVMIEEDQAQMESEYDEYELESMFGEAEPDEDGEVAFFTEYDELEEAEVETEHFRLDDDAEYDIPSDQIDQINRLYIGAYTVKKDYENVIRYARILQSREGIQNTHMGRYAEANAYLMMESPEAPAKYAQTIKFFRNAMIKDPTDLAAVTFRIQCCIDIGEYAEAERICNLLAKEMQEPILEKIEQAKTGGV